MLRTVLRFRDFYFRALTEKEKKNPLTLPLNKKVEGGKNERGETVKYCASGMNPVKSRSP